jgi:hypothetical protein
MFVWIVEGKATLRVFDASQSADFEFVKLFDDTISA